MEARDEAQFGVAGGRTRQEARQALHRIDARKERVAALFGGLDRGDAPFFEFFVGPIGVEVDFASSGGKRGDESGAELGGLADDIVHRAAFGQALSQDDRAR